MREFPSDYRGRGKDGGQVESNSTSNPPNPTPTVEHSVRHAILAHHFIWTTPLTCLFIVRVPDSYHIKDLVGPIYLVATVALIQHAPSCVWPDTLQQLLFSFVIFLLRCLSTSL